MLFGDVTLECNTRARVGYHPALDSQWSYVVAVGGMGIYVIAQHRDLNAAWTAALPSVFQIVCMSARASTRLRAFSSHASTLGCLPLFLSTY